MLKIRKPSIHDTSITSYQYYVYTPYTTSFANRDEIRIAIQSQEGYVLPCESTLYIEGSVVRSATAAADAVDPTISRNFAAFLFDNVRYEIGGVEVDRVKNPGITSLLKGYPSIRESEYKAMETSTFSPNDMITTNLRASYSLNIPLSLYMGFFEDYKNVVVNMKHELILTRSQSDINCFFGDSDVSTMNITKIQWRVPIIKLDDATQLKMLKQIDSNQPIPMAFRSWDLYEYPTLPTTDRHVWTVKTASNLRRPRYVILGLQTNRNNQIANNKAIFDHCNITEAKVYLNSECYPKESMQLNFTTIRAAILYEMYAKFQESYYHDGSKTPSDVILTYTSFLTTPFFVFDCSRQNESIKSSSVDVRIEFQCSANVAANTAAYCLIIHDNIISYNPLTNIVTQNL
jgi:hypothetical protein